jgi:hypothetical protein
VCTFAGSVFDLPAALCREARLTWLLPLAIATSGVVRAGSFGSLPAVFVGEETLVGVPALGGEKLVVAHQNHLVGQNDRVVRCCQVRLVPTGPGTGGSGRQCT